jgi:twinkle protein
VAGNKILGDTACPQCRSHGRDSKSNHLILMQREDGTKHAYCNRCGYRQKDAESVQARPKKEWPPEELKERLEEISGYQTQELTSRRIPDWVAEFYGVKVGLSVYHKNEVVEHYYPYTNDQGEVVRYNVRILEPKAFYSIGPANDAAPFGYETLNRKNVSKLKLFIFEDELSAMSGYLVLKEFAKGDYKHLHPSCIGLIAGSVSIANTLAYLKDRGILDQYKEVVYVHDNDEAGFDSYNMGRKFYPELRELTTPLKDANDMVMEGRWKELFLILIRNANIRSPDGAATVDDALQDALEEPTQGLSLPWEGLTKLLFGLRWGELWSLGGGTGSGKTLLMHVLAAWFIKQHKVKVAMFMLEETIGQTLKRVATQIAKVPFYRPDVAFNKDLLMSVVNDVLRGFLYLWKNKGANDWENISACIRYYAVVEGVKLFIVDNVTALTNTLAPTEQNTEISRIATEAAGIADDLNITIILLSHLNPPSSGPSHEEGGEVRPNQFTGSRALQRWSHVMLGFERDSQATGDEKHMSRIRVIKDRFFGRTGVIFTQYNTETGGLNEYTIEPEVEVSDDQRTW